jgi:16S rRNA (guanine527-N7)-methyltransferase
VLSEAAIHELLEQFGTTVSDSQVRQVLTYLELLVRWNSKINLTAIRSPEECVTRHFGESFFLAKELKLEGALVDIGSGAGFPGLALKIIAPDLRATLLEPIAKKRAFLKEAARACGMSHVETLGRRLDAFAAGVGSKRFDIATVRAVGDLPALIRDAEKCLKAGGKLCIWLGSRQAEAVRLVTASILWQDPVPIPFSKQRVILIGACGERDKATRESLLPPL